MSESEVSQDRQGDDSVKSEPWPIRIIYDPKEVKRSITVRPEFQEHADEIIKMIANSGALIEGDFHIHDGHTFARRPDGSWVEVDLY